MPVCAEAANQQLCRTVELTSTLACVSSSSVFTDRQAYELEALTAEHKDFNLFFESCPMGDMLERIVLATADNPTTEYDATSRVAPCHPFPNHHGINPKPRSTASYNRVPCTAS